MKNSKILWINPWFGNYRLPVYKELLKQTDGNFFLISGSVDMDSSLVSKLPNELEGHCTVIDNSKRIVIGNPDSDMANCCVRIPLPHGVLRNIRKIKPDVIIVDGFFQWAPVALWYCFWHRIPLIIDYERTVYVERNSPRWRTLYRKIFGKFVSGFVVNGSLTTEYLNLLGLSDRPIVEGCMAADSMGLSQKVISLSNGERHIIRKNILGDNNGFIYLFVGQLVERKGVIQMIKAWNEHSKDFPDDKLLILGKGILKTVVEDLIKGNQSIILLGQVPYSEIYKYYGSSDIFLMPTIEDNWSLVVPEAMSCSLPILCSKYNGCYPELVKDGQNGYVFDPLDHKDFVEKLQRIRLDDLGALGKRSFELQLDYSPSKSASRIITCCKMVCDTN